LLLLFATTTAATARPTTAAAFLKQLSESVHTGGKPLAGGTPKPPHRFNFIAFTAQKAAPTLKHAAEAVLGEQPLGHSSMVRHFPPCLKHSRALALVVSWQRSPPTSWDVTRVIYFTLHDKVAAAR
jgi:hypothetical protein